MGDRRAARLLRERGRRDGAREGRCTAARRAYGAPGTYDLKLTMRRADRTLAVATLEIVVCGSSAGP